MPQTEKEIANGSPTGQRPISGVFWKLPRKTPSKSTPPNFDHEGTHEVEASKSYNPKKTMDPNHTPREKEYTGYKVGAHNNNVKEEIDVAGPNKDGKSIPNTPAEMAKIKAKKQMDPAHTARADTKADRQVDGDKAYDGQAEICAKKEMDPKHTARAKEYTGYAVGAPNNNVAEGEVNEKNWIAGAIKHPGAEKRAAKRAGMSTHSYMEKHKHDSGKSGDRARLGLTLSKMHKDEYEMDDQTQEGQLDEMESAEEVQFNQAMDNQLDLAVRSVMSDDPSAFQQAFNTVLNVYLQQKVAERKNHLQSTFLGTQTSAAGTILPTEEETNGEDTTTDSTESA